MFSVVVVIQHAPYLADNKAWHALRFAGAALTEDMDVRVHLLDEGVEVGRKNHHVLDGLVNLESLLAELIECGLKVCACGMSLDGCALDAENMIDGIERGSMKSLAAWVKQSDQVMVF